MTDAGSGAGALCSLAPFLIAALRDLGSVWRCRRRRALPGRAGMMLMEEALSGVGLRLSAAWKMASRGNELGL